MRSPSLVFLCACLFSVSAYAASAQATRNVVVVTLDGLRWQEVFRGADDTFLTPEAGGVSTQDLPGIQKRFGGDARDKRREALMPFLWGTMARQGQVLGNRDRGSPMRVKNSARVSYPGYHELLCGFPNDQQIRNNDLIPNPDVTVLEWLNRDPEFAGKVVPVAAWTAFRAIFNPERSRLPVWVADPEVRQDTNDSVLRDLERWMRDIPIFDGGEHYDAFVHRAALNRLETVKPRVLFVGLGEPDVFAHRRQYGGYLDSIQRCDRFIAELWTALQAMPEYRGTTTLIVTCDHGRGATTKDWTDHGADVVDADQTWLAVLGPDTPALGERHDIPEVTSAQIAATVAQALGRDFAKTDARIAAPMAEVVGLKR